MRSTPSTEGRPSWRAWRVWRPRFAYGRLVAFTHNHILTSVSRRFLTGFGGIGGLGIFPLGVSGRISLGVVPSFRTSIEPRLEVILMVGPSPTLPFRVVVRPSVSFWIGGPKSLTASPRSAVAS